ncbi:Ceramide synthase 5 [Mizuhopecten yessoensis]|uniref:Ceramide synthase 5 n=1 Tax=Mizuhopecten yessoensis TaxID=6573 RepID=A0A210R5B9_MIZYE|nr:Ceramide synthase 5 [Mizuhopecten yessoensis]
MANFQALRDWFWDEKFWLLSNATWDDFENPPPGVYYPLERHILLPSLLIGVLLIGIRLAYERLLVIPFALYMGLTFKKHYAVEKNPSLEAVYATDKYPEQDQVQELSKKTSLTERQIQRWFRHRRSREMPGRMQKFRECSRHGCGDWHLRGTCHVSNDVFWFYTIELAFYWNLVFTVLSDHKRKDSTQMFIHHMVTIALIYFSFAINTVRIGALVIVVHDSVDLWMAGAKMANYLKKDTLTDTMFGIFFVVWLLTRLYIYPFKMVWSASFESLQYQAMWPSYWLLNGLLWILQVLHVIWTFMILRIVLNKFTGEKKVKDVRSDTEESTGKEEEGEKSQERDVIVNGSPTLRSPDSVGRRKKCKA